MRTCRFVALTFPLNRCFQPYIFCYDFPKTAKVVGKHTKKGRKVETDIAIPLLYRTIYYTVIYQFACKTHFPSSTWGIGVKTKHHYSELVTQLSPYDVI